MKSVILSVFGTFFLLAACTDYVDEYKGDYEEAYGNEETFRKNLDKLDWEWLSSCEEGDWIWCAASSNGYMKETSAGASWSMFSDGTVDVYFSGKDDQAYNFMTNYLPSDPSPIIRRNGGIAFLLKYTSGEFTAGIQVSLGGIDLSERYSGILFAYSNEYPGAYAALRELDSDGNVRSEYRWKLAQGSVAVAELSFKNLERVSGESDLESFLKKANTFAVVLTEDAPVSNGINVVALGLVSKNEVEKSSSSQGGSGETKTSSSSAKSSSSAASSSSAKSSSSVASSSSAKSSSSVASSSSAKSSSSVKSSSSQETGFIWKGEKDELEFHTGFAMTEWRYYTDNSYDDPGASTVTVPDSALVLCHGYCGYVQLKQGSRSTPDLAAHVGFLMNKFKATDPHDVSDWSGLCVTYTSTYPINLMLYPNDAESNGWIMPKKTLEATTTDNQYITVRIPWNQFVADSEKPELSGEAVAKKLSDVIFSFDGTDGTNAFFNIYQVGRDSLCGSPSKKSSIGISYFVQEPYDALIRDFDLIWYGGNKLKGKNTYLVQNKVMDYVWVSEAAKTYFDFHASIDDGVIPDNVISNCRGGICAKAGVIPDTAYPTLGFVIDTAALHVDEWGGVCLTYEASIEGIELYLGITDESYSRDSLDWDFYHVVLPAQSMAEYCVSLKDFKREGRVKNVKLDKYLPRVDQIAFMFKENVGNVSFNLVALGKYDTGVNEYWTFMQDKANKTSAWDYLNPTIEYGVFTDSRDNQKYKNVKIGSLTWMAENLNYRYGTTTDSSSFCLRNNSGNCVMKGRLYLWSAAMDSVKTNYGRTANAYHRVTKKIQGVCPSGWHLPSRGEAQALVNYAKNQYSSDANKSLMSKVAWGSFAATDNFGFSAVPSGYAVDAAAASGSAGANTGFSNADSMFFWTTGEYDGNSDASGGYAMSFVVGKDAMAVSKFRKWNAVPVRCVKDPVFGSFKDTRDNQTYKTVVIGGKTWMAQNLNYRYGTTTSDSLSSCYNNTTGNCDSFGRLYLWSAAMDSAGLNTGKPNNCGVKKTCSPGSVVQGVCPTGWHLPSKSEWLALINEVGGSAWAGVNLRRETLEWSLENDSLTPTYASGDPFGFGLLPAGQCELKSSTPCASHSYFRGSRANFWSSTEMNDSLAFYIHANSWSNGLGYPESDNKNRMKDIGYSVRCVKD